MKRLLILIISILLLAPLAYAGGYEDFSAFNLDWSGGNNSRLAFYSPLTSTASVLSPPRAYPGTAGTFSRSSAVYFTDYQGVIQSVASGYPAIEGSRVSGNTCYSTDATGAALPQSYSERANSTAYTLGQRIQVSGWWYNCTTAGTSAGSAPTFPQGYAGSQTVTDGTAVWTIGGRLLLGYVSEPASTNKVTAYGIIPADALGSELASGSLTIGQKYQITARTDANFTADGAADNVVGTQFVATAATVTLDAGDKVKRVQWGVGEKSFHNGSSFVQNISGLTLSGDVAGLTKIADGTTLVTNAGLLGINATGKVYEADNSAGSAASINTFTGTAGNTNKHSGSIYIAKISGSGTTTLEINGTTTTITGATLQRFKVENVTPASGSQLILNVGVGDKVQFLLMDMEELSYASSPIPTSGATVTRAATVDSYPVTGNIPSTTAWTLKIPFIGMGTSTTTTRYLFSSYVDANNYTRLGINGVIAFIEKNVAGVKEFVTVPFAPVVNTKYTAVMRRNADGTMNLWVGGTKDLGGLGSELVVNGDMSSSVGWTGNGAGGWSITGGVAQHTAGSSGGLDQSGILTTGRLYKYYAKIMGRTASSSSAYLGNTLLANMTETGTLYGFATASTATTTLSNYGNTAFDGALDDVSVKEVYNSTTATAPILGTTFQVASYNSLSQYAGWIPGVSIYAKGLADDRCKALSQ